jgi:hypothetical protein
MRKRPFPSVIVADASFPTIWILTCCSGRPVFASTTEPATAPVWAAAVVATRSKANAEPARLAKELLPPGERDVRIFPSEEL